MRSFVCPQDLTQLPSVAKAFDATATYPPTKIRNAKYARTAAVSLPHEENAMQWSTPDFEEITLNCEINSYARAEL